MLREGSSGIEENHDHARTINFCCFDRNSANAVRELEIDFMAKLRDIDF